MNPTHFSPVSNPPAMSGRETRTPTSATSPAAPRTPPANNPIGRLSNSSSVSGANAIAPMAAPAADGMTQERFFTEATGVGSLGSNGVSPSRAPAISFSARFSRLSSSGQ